MDKFNVIWEDNGKFAPYDVIPYLKDRYEALKKKDKPKTFDEFKEFIRKESMYMWWSRTQYEIIITDWPSKTFEEKWDIHKQVMMNIDVITQVLIESLHIKL